MALIVALYKGTRPGLAGVYSWGVRRQTKGPYSHCELLFSNGESASSSFVDKGVRFKHIEYRPEHWDFIEVPAALETYAMQWFARNAGAKYDLLGNVHFVFPVIGDTKKAYSCAEAVACALQMPDGWRYNPNSLAVALRAYKKWELLKD